METILWVLAGQTVVGLALFYTLRYLSKKHWEKFDTAWPSPAVSPLIQNIRDDLADQREWNR